MYYNASIHVRSAISIQDTQARKQLKEKKVVVESLFRFTILFGKLGLDNEVPLVDPYYQGSQPMPQKMLSTPETIRSQMISIVGNHSYRKLNLQSCNDRVPISKKRTLRGMHVLLTSRSLFTQSGIIINV